MMIDIRVILLPRSSWIVYVRYSEHHSVPRLNIQTVCILRVVLSEPIFSEKDPKFAENLVRLGFL